MKRKILLASFITVFIFTIIFNFSIVFANFESRTMILSNEQKNVEKEEEKKPSQGFENEKFEESDTKVIKQETLVKTKRKAMLKSKAITANGLSWEIVDGVLTISGKGEIQDAVYTQDLSKMAPWYNQRDKIKKVVIKDGVTKIGNGVFFNCNNLAEIEVPDTITTIGNYAFQKTALKTFYIPSSLTTLSISAFYNVPLEAFTGGSKLYQVKDGVLYIDDGKTLAKYPANKKDTNFIIPNGVTKLGYESFFLTTKIKSVTIPDSVVDAREFTFCRSSIEKVKFGKGLKCTSFQMFAGSPNLKEIDWGTSIEGIFNQTFMECTGLTSVSLPNNIRLVGAGAFYRCTNLVSFTSKNLSVIPFQMFFECYKLNNVNLNEGITSISRSAFYYCYNLKNITLPQSVTYVHSIAFPSNTVINCKNTELRKYGKNGYRYINDVRVAGSRKYSFAFEVLKLVNTERKKQGLATLKMDEGLLETAMIRATENSVLFSHTRPDGSICFDLDNKMIAENVAFGQRTAKEVMKAWMNSPGHKENILKKDATTIGIGCFYHNGIYYWSQNFGNGNNKTDCAQPRDKNRVQKIALATEKFTEAITSEDVVYNQPQEYSYNFYIKFDKPVIENGKKTTARVYLTNAGVSFAKTIIDNSSFYWSSACKNTAKVYEDGAIRARSNGIATIKARLRYLKIKKKIVVGKNSNYPETMKTPNVNVQNGRKIYVSWKRDSSVRGYQIRYSRSNQFDTPDTTIIDINDNRTTGNKIKKLKAGKKYYVQIRAYKKVMLDGQKQRIYSNWSSYKKIVAKN